MFSGHVFDWLVDEIGPRQEFVDAAVGMATDDPGDDVGEVGERIDAGELAGFD